MMCFWMGPKYLQEAYISYFLFPSMQDLPKLNVQWLFPDLYDTLGFNDPQDPSS